MGGAAAETYTCVENHNPGAVNVEVTYLTPSGKGNVTFSDELLPESRKTYRMGALLQGPASILVKSMDGRRPVIVERSMYTHDKAAGTNVMGAFSN